MGLRHEFDLRRKTYPGGLYETAVECKGIPLVFVLLGVFVFAVAFARESARAKESAGELQTMKGGIHRKSTGAHLENSYIK